MASKQASPVNTSIVRAPAGFRRLGSVANAGWFDMKTVGNVLQGTFEGMFERKDDLNPSKKSKFFQIQITSDCQVRMGRGEDAKILSAKAGDFVNVNYGPKTKELEDLLSDYKRGAQYEIYGVVAGEKIKLTGGRTMHNFEVFTNMTVAPKELDVIPDFDTPDATATA